ncbi:hypothetical protein C8R47DRAFT_1071399 [Mycena vitilis]|nr:hypothetical protein C8R47DRAFT_1071399 [Mycena vitilis]
MFVGMWPRCGSIWLDMARLARSGSIWLAVVFTGHDEQLNALHAQRAKVHSRGYRELNAARLARLQRLRRQEAFCDKHGVKAWVVRQARQDNQKSIATATTTTPTSSIGAERLAAAKAARQSRRDAVEQATELLTEEIAARREARARSFCFTLIKIGIDSRERKESEGSLGKGIQLSILYTSRGTHGEMLGVLAWQCWVGTCWAPYRQPFRRRSGHRPRMGATGAMLECHQIPAHPTGGLGIAKRERGKATELRWSGQRCSRGFGNARLFAMLLPRPHSRTPCVPFYYPSPGNEDVAARSRQARLKFYIALAGLVTGIFTEEHEARAQVNGISDGHWRVAKTWAIAIEIWDRHCQLYHGDGCATIPPQAEDGSPSPTSPHTTPTSPPPITIRIPSRWGLVTAVGSGSNFTNTPVKRAANVFIAEGSGTSGDADVE